MSDMSWMTWRQSTHIQPMADVPLPNFERKKTQRLEATESFACCLPLHLVDDERASDHVVQALLLGREGRHHITNQ